VALRIRSAFDDDRLRADMSACTQPTGQGQLAGSTKAASNGIYSSVGGLRD